MQASEAENMVAGSVTFYPTLPFKAGVVGECYYRSSTQPSEKYL
jgi:hypothetical protein